MSFRAENRFGTFRAAHFWTFVHLELCTTTTKIFSSAGSIFAGIKGRIHEAVHYQERALRQDPTGAVINTANYDKSQAGYEILTKD